MAMLAVFTLLLASQTPTYDEAFAQRLLKWREQFESVLVDPDRDLGYITLYCETLGPCHSMAYYPIGSASERFMISYNGDKSFVIHEQRRGAKAYVDWYVPILNKKSKAKPVGTIAKILKGRGWSISPRAKMTSKVRKALRADYTFAGFFYHPMEGGMASIVTPDGKSMETHKAEGMYSIIPEEIELLRQAKKG